MSVHHTIPTGRLYHTLKIFMLIYLQVLRLGDNESDTLPSAKEPGSA